MSEGLLMLTRTVTPTECPWLHAPVEAGRLVRRFQRPTYGCVDESVGTAVTFDLTEGNYPFVELPSDALAPAVSPSPEPDRAAALAAADQTDEGDGAVR